MRIRQFLQRIPAGDLIPSLIISGTGDRQPSCRFAFSPFTPPSYCLDILLSRAYMLRDYFLALEVRLKTSEVDMKHDVAARRALVTGVLGLLLTTFVSVALAQSAGSITGTVKDSQGNAIVGAK